jgi:hypothetical protein
MRILFVLVCFVTFIFAGNADRNDSDIKQKALFKGREHYDKRLHDETAKKDVKREKERFNDCARRKDGTFDTQKYLKECSQK